MNLSAIFRNKEMNSVFDASKYCVQIFAPSLTDSMRIVCRKFEAVKIDVCWFKMQANPSNDCSKFAESKRIGDNLFLIEGEMRDFYSSPVRYESLSVLRSLKKEYILRIDDDEIVSDQLVQRLKTTTSTLEKGSAIAFRRLWVKRDESGNWVRSRSAFSPNESYDWQTRLFRINDAQTATGVHDGDFKFRKIVKITEPGVNIFHLILELLDLESRVKRVAHYESVLRGSGLTKIRYYIPELLGTSNLFETLNDATQTEMNSWNLIP